MLTLARILYQDTGRKSASTSLPKVPNHREVEMKPEVKIRQPTMKP